MEWKKYLSAYQGQINRINCELPINSFFRLSVLIVVERVYEKTAQAVGYYPDRFIVKRLGRRKRFSLPNAEWFGMVSPGLKPQNHHMQYSVGFLPLIGVLT